VVKTANDQLNSLSYRLCCLRFVIDDLIAYDAIVADPPKPVIELLVNGEVAMNSTVNEGSSATLRCSSDRANPAASAIWWSKDGIPVQNSEDVLEISAVARSHAGKYTCTAGNTMTPSGGQVLNGTGTASVVLQVLRECVEHL
jgi:Immunoglobulin domain